MNVCFEAIDQNQGMRDAKGETKRQQSSASPGVGSVRDRYRESERAWQGRRQASGAAGGGGRAAQV